VKTIKHSNADRNRAVSRGDSAAIDVALAACAWVRSLDVGLHGDPSRAASSKISPPPGKRQSSHYPKAGVHDDWVFNGANRQRNALGAGTNPQQNQKLLDYFGTADFYRT
jgi:hypothetical protein